MSDVVIRAAGLGKKYIIGHEMRRESYIALRDVIAREAHNFFRKAGDMVRGRPIIEGDEIEEIWALRDVSFDVKRGEVIGVIGRNGAGKSTLLKIFSRITDPSEGRVTISGRLASLLEVGTGFHPELTGRENIFLNAAILGMSRAEIRKKLDEIVAFAEIERFLDTPVKRFSSGMYVRLAFAVAAHVEPEILIVDEVLAVGDFQFQQKCLGKMDDISRDGRTVLFVSHNMATVRRLCTSAILLVAGHVSRYGTPVEVIARYLEDDRRQEGDSGELNLRAPEHPFILHRVEVINASGNPSSALANDEPFRVRLTYELTAPMRQLRVGFRLHAQDSTVVLSSTNCDSLGGNIPSCPPGLYASEVEFPPQLLNSGGYYLWIGVDIPMICAVLSVANVMHFSIKAVAGIIADVNDGRLGVVAPLLPWSLHPIPS